MDRHLISTGSVRFVSLIVHRGISGSRAHSQNLRHRPHEDNHGHEMTKSRINPAKDFINTLPYITTELR